MPRRMDDRQLDDYLRSLALGMGDPFTNRIREHIAALTEQLATSEAERRSLYVALLAATNQPCPADANAVEREVYTTQYVTCHGNQAARLLRADTRELIAENQRVMSGLQATAREVGV